MTSRNREEMNEELTDNFGVWESAGCANQQGLYGKGEYI